jgi:hypothetical protein
MYVCPSGFSTRGAFVSSRIKPDQGWLSGRQAREQLGVSVNRLFKLAALGTIRTRALPGEPIRYALVDVERLAQSQSEETAIRH